MKVHILIIGREILTGRTLDTNSHWLCRKIRSMGSMVERIAVVNDELSTIVKEIRLAFEWGCGLIITSGGLGPTKDDMTLEAVSRASGLSLEENEEALALIEGSYREFYRRGAVASPELTAERRKMALLPKGAEALANPVGAAPGVWLETPGCVIACLPGVPSELKAIFEAHVEPRVRELLGAGYTVLREVETPLGDESVLAPIVERAMKRVPGVYMKTLPTTFGPEVRLRVRLEASGPQEEEVKERVELGERALLEEIALFRPSP